ncbi:hypothetical protein EPR50_G00184770 [Perca flavescens]|uniref:DUF6729 domain-containing protein n=1 Tax=Perca flavescens TaxID=8167 RepID=A0A484C8W8_PERFV|nr:hypothetical protein EPR50_G00184770 [Perca flavescens]
MTKTGKPDAYWAGVMSLYAQGKYTFTTGKRPGSRRWRAVMLRIADCPLTPLKGQTTVRKLDIFGKTIPCKCGYHQSAEKAGTAASSQGQLRAPQASAATQFGFSQSAGKAAFSAGQLCLNSAESLQASAGATATGSQASAAAGKAVTVPGPQTGVAQKTPALCRMSEGKSLTCSLCSQEMMCEDYTQHLSDYHTQEQCEQCGAKAWGAFGLLQHIEECHLLTCPTDLPDVAAPTTPIAQETTQQPSDPPDVPAPVPAPPTAHETSLAPPRHPLTLQPPEVNWVNFLPKQFTRVIQPADQEWITHILYDSTGQLKQNLSNNWFHPPSPTKSISPPDPHNYFRQRMFLWAPMRMWGIPLKCTQCNRKMHHSGIYTKAREVIDIDSKYYLVGGDYPRCSKCMIPVCPWSIDILKQLDPSHRYKFPAVLTTHLALDRRCVAMLRPRTLGNSSSYLQQALQEIHSEEWARRTIDYLTDCEVHKKSCVLTQSEALYQPPPPFSPLPLAQWFETVHANDILNHLDELKGVITSTLGRILKLDSTKKITKKLAGGIEGTATWMSNIGNEFGQVLNSVLTTGEGAGLDDLCQGIVKRYSDADEPQPDAIYVDRDCCSETGVGPILTWFRPWTSTVRLDIFHFMRRFTKGLTTEHHPLYGTFCSKLSTCIFEWDKEDIHQLKEAKRAELKKKHQGHVPTDSQVLSSITSSELVKHCRRRTRGVEETRVLIKQLLDSMWDLTDTSGLHLINHDSMSLVWEVQQKHLPCIQDPPGVQLYTNTGSGLEKGDKTLDVLRCGRGSSSLESFHLHQCGFIPGKLKHSIFETFC